MFHRVGPAALKPGLDNTIQLLARLGNPEQHFRSIHIAGTNGKGSSSHMLAAILQVAGYKTGLYTSPHLKSFTERIKVNGMDIDKDFVVAFVNRNKQHMEEIRPSFFEVTVGMAFEYFATHQVDIAIIETGLGGRLDSTNVVLPLVSLITNISYDHQSILGNSLEQIAGEKAGIIKPHIPVVISETQEAQVRTVFLEKAKAAGSDIFFADQEFIVEAVASHDEMLHVDVFRKNKMVLSDLRLSLTGDYQVKNAAGVLAVLDLLSHMNFPVTETNIRTGLEETVTLTGLKGRWQRLNDSPLTICDTGHNEAGIKLIVEQVKKIPFDKLH
jgi:dihydrofolate synthase/folylpolyglutamate synthase